MAAERPTAIGMPTRGVLFRVDMPKILTVTQIEKLAQATKSICLIGSTISHGIMSFGFFFHEEIILFLKSGCHFNFNVPCIVQLVAK